MILQKIHTRGSKLTKVKFITEIASTHDGSEKEFNKLLKKIKLIKDDYIKFQIFENSELYVEVVNYIKV